MAGRGHEELAETGLPQPLLDATLPGWCALCGSKATEWIYEIGLSVEYSDWEAAQRALRRAEFEQQLAAWVRRFPPGSGSTQ